MRRANAGRARGFTLIEALAAVVLVSVGLVAATQCLAAIAAARARTLDTETMQQLAFRKYDEVLAEGKLVAGQANGDFSDIGEKRFTWQADRTATGDGNLDSLRIRVSRESGQFVEAQGLVCRTKKATQ